MTKPSYEELKAKLAELEAKQQRGSTMSLKVSDKGGVSVYCPVWVAWFSARRGRAVTRRRARPSRSRPRQRQSSMSHKP
jgi:hypothetical protein